MRESAVEPDIRIAILEDQPIFRDTLVALLQAEDLQVVATASSTEEFLRQMDALQPEVAIVDLRLERPGAGIVENGLTAVRELSRTHPDVRQLVLSGEWDPRTVSECYAAGASAFLCKLEAGRDTVLAAVRALGRGEQRLPDNLEDLSRRDAEVRAHAHPLAHLTPRERDVLRYVAQGMDNLKVAAHLGITERTVKAHVCSLYRKLGVENRAEMALKGRELGLRGGLAH
ncbi:response regulator transcription factor [Aggregicoccus sp. 17bor-14]|uniref:response regulator transcription factor n=1 Tax=Myxococcaceae TaxID=31 RepID=UPI00129CC57E|nr:MULTISPECIES: response regulator transcription factor [Myxococcaceae]MBF5045947.1 response regulator transcription factor [Simulacricoccus sp. 17bor-14]MRI91679.1 response regulator transcription factor [Aggregicoccus sp. 17bor-14]